MADALKQFLNECKFRDVRLEHKYWDKARIGEEKTRRAPDILATHPTSGREYVIDCRIFWNTMSDSSSGGYASYTTTGVGCLRGEAQKKRSWEKAMKRKLAEGYDDIEFVLSALKLGGFGDQPRGAFSTGASTLRTPTATSTSTTGPHRASEISGKTLFLF